MKRLYVEHTFRAETLELIDTANDIVEEYLEQGFDLTLRQLYYQMVARGFIPNNQQSYKRLGNVISDARRAGLVDWEAIVDRTRNLRERQSWENPRQILDAAVSSYHLDRWVGQQVRVEVWIEKDALIGVIAGICTQYDVPYFACRGYVSDSEMWVASMRILKRAVDDKQGTVILHFGDHDPSGIDMTRDITDRLAMFGCGKHVCRVIRLALNMNQVQQYNPPPNPAKITDSRAGSYIRTHGRRSWELDALDPATLTGLIGETIQKIIDWDMWHEIEETEKEHKAALQAASDEMDL